MKEYGLDLSKHNGALDFSKIKKEGHAFVILRAGYGTSTKDPKFEEYYKKAKALGLKVGAYWYSYALNESGAEKEAKKCLEILKGKQFEYPIFFDMEDADGYKKKNGMPSNAVLSKMCDKFCSVIESNGYYAGVYASESWFKNQLKTMSNKYDKWVANWGTNNGKLQSDKSSSYRLHQFTSEYKLDGKRFDKNISYYDYAKVIKEKGLNGFKKTSSGSTTPSKKTVDQLADEVIAGKWGNGEDRKQRLTKTGYDYNAVQKKVNEKTSTSKYYKKYTGKSAEIDTVFKAIGAPYGNYKKRKPVSEKNGVKNYSGTASQNLSLIKLAKEGKLKK